MKRRLPASLYSVKGITLCLCIPLLSAGCAPSSVATRDNNPMLRVAQADDAESASRRTKEMADWVVSSKDNRNKPFAIIDKVNAKVHTYGPDGKPRGEAPVLLGLAKGDYSVPGIGNKSYSQIKNSERTTPAGRFESVMGKNHKGKDILWLDYEDALSMHAVVKGIPSDRRYERLASLTPLDNRISYGCINVPKPYFKDVIQGNFSGNGGVVYILPETAQFNAASQTMTANRQSAKL